MYLLLEYRLHNRFKSSNCWTGLDSLICNILSDHDFDKIKREACERQSFFPTEYVSTEVYL